MKDLKTELVDFFAWLSKGCRAIQQDPIIHEKLADDYLISKNHVKIQKRELPCFVVSCPICGAAFMGSALDPDLNNDSEHNKELLDNITRYARAGCDISVKDASEFKLGICDHMRNI